MRDYYRIKQTDGNETHDDWTDINGKSNAEKQSIKDGLKAKMKSANYKYQIIHATHGLNEIGNGPCTMEDE